MLDRNGLITQLDELIGASAPDVDVALVLVGQLVGLTTRLGSEVTDVVVDEVARRLITEGGPGAMVARSGPEAFVLVRPGGADIDAWGERLAASLDAPFEASGLLLRLSCNLAFAGASLAEWEVDEGRALLQELEDAVLMARMDSPDLLLRLPEARRTRPDRDAMLAARLLQAVEQGEIVARYQPIIDLASGEVVGAEALARWDGAGPELARPEQFLGLAQAMGLMPSITDRILDQAGRDFADGVPAEQGWWVSVNLDASESLHPEMAGRIDAALTSSGLAPDRLVIEVSERIVPDPVAVRSLRSMADIGVRVAIDDFGSGWSSLAQLRSLPLALVKLDRSIVAVETNGDIGILKATVALAASLGLEVLAEGIESGEDLLLAEVVGVALGQGFLWGAASTIESLAASAAGGSSGLRSRR